MYYFQANEKLTAFILEMSKTKKAPEDWEGFIDTIEDVFLNPPEKPKKIKCKECKTGKGWYSKNGFNCYCSTCNPNFWSRTIIEFVYYGY